MADIRSHLAHRPIIDPSAYIDAAAVVIGEVEICAEVSIWPAVVLRGDQGAIRIGAQSNLQDGTIVHCTGGRSQTTVGERVTVGHRALLHGCIVEDDCLIGMGAILLDNCRIGRGSIVGAGSLVTSGTVVPEGSLVLGSPAKVVRSLREGEHEGWIEHGCAEYLRLAKTYRES
jgi:gamma-carbonic anhydrase